MSTRGLFFVLAAVAGTTALACGAAESDELASRPLENAGSGGDAGTNTPLRNGDSGATPTPTPEDRIESLTAEETRVYLSQVAPYIKGRELDPGELAIIEASRGRAIPEVVSGFTKSAGFESSARRFIERVLTASGTRDGIDFSLPGNLVVKMVKEDLPLETLLTADYCVDAAGDKKACDTGAPFSAGVLATRAFVSNHLSRFNLSRASGMMKTFACLSYPMDSSIQPYVDKADLIGMFSATNEAEFSDAGGGTSNFGNGFACYACHGQFSAHAQVFVKFDTAGAYQPESTGLQDPKGELGRSPGNLFTSHFAAPERAKDESSQMMGKPVKNLREAAIVLAESPRFVPCQIRHWLEYVLQLPTTEPFDAAVQAELASSIAQSPGGATLRSLVEKTFSHPAVVSAVLDSIGASSP